MERERERGGEIGVAVLTYCNIHWQRLGNVKAEENFPGLSASYQTCQIGLDRL